MNIKPFISAMKTNFLVCYMQTKWGCRWWRTGILKTMSFGRNVNIGSKLLYFILYLAKATVNLLLFLESNHFRFRETSRWANSGFLCLFRWFAKRQGRNMTLVK